jgi:hypothetical protein
MASTFLGAKDTKKLIKAHIEAAVLGGGAGTYTPLCLWGHKGVGKTSFINQIAEELGQDAGAVLKEYFKKDKLKVKVISYQLSALQAFDLGGYPYTEKIKVNGVEIEVQRFATPINFVEDKNFHITIIFLDEINRSRVEMQNALMGILDGRGVNQHPIPKNVYVISAANPETDDSDYGAITDITDEAILDRLVHINVDVTRNEALEYLYNNKTAHKSMYYFLQEDTTRLEQDRFKSVTDANSKKIKGSFRSANKVSSFVEHLDKAGYLNNMKDNKVLIKAFAKGLLGDSLGEIYVDRLNSFHQVITPQQILGQVKVVRKTITEALTTMVRGSGKVEARLDEVAKIHSSLVLHLNANNREELTKTNIKNLLEYLDIVPHDMKEELFNKVKFNDTELEALGRDNISEVLTEAGLDPRKLTFR